MALLLCPDVVEATVSGARRYERHKPETTVFYRLVQQHLLSFISEVEASGSTVPRYVRRAFDGYLECEILGYGFARAFCEVCHKSLVVAWSCKGRGACPLCFVVAYVVDFTSEMPSLLARQSRRGFCL